MRELLTLKEEKAKKLKAVYKYIFRSDNEKVTSEIEMYIKLRDFLEGSYKTGLEIKDPITHFNSVLNLDGETLYITADLVEAIQRGFVKQSKNGYVNKKSGTLLGRNFQDSVTFLKENDREYGTGTSDDDTVTILSQLNN